MALNIGSNISPTSSLKILNSTIILILANLYPVYGVIYLDWSIGEILLLYWCETLIIAFFTILKVIFNKQSRINNPRYIKKFSTFLIPEVLKSIYDKKDIYLAKLKEKGTQNPITKDDVKGFLKDFGLSSANEPELINKEEKDVSNFAKTSIIVVFILKYAFDIFFFLLFVIAFAILPSKNIGNGMITSDLSNWQNAFRSTLSVLKLPILIVFVTHLFAFIQNYILRKEDESLYISQIIRNFWHRNYTMHLTLIIGALIIYYFQNASYLIIALLLAKVIVDIKHNIEEQIT